MDVSLATSASLPSSRPRPRPGTTVDSRLDAPTVQVVFSHTSDNIVSYRMLTPEGKTLVVQTSIRTGDQCIICVARVMNLHQPFPVNVRPAGAPIEDPYSSR